MTGVLILVAVLAVPYVVLNLRRLRLGRPWAFTFCQAAKEWEQRERAKLLAARAADRPRSDSGGFEPPLAGIAPWSGDV